MDATAGWEIPEGFNFTRDVVEHYAADPHRRALTFVDRVGVIQRLTFAQVAADAARWTNLLRGRGCEPGDRVLVMLRNTPEWAGVMLGGIKGGLVTVPCSETLPARDIAFRTRQSGASLVVADRGSETEVDAARGMLDTELDVLFLDEASELLRGCQPDAPTEARRADDPAFVLYTSGTAAEPKGVTQSHAYTYAKRMQAWYWLDAKPGDLVWCTAETGSVKSIWNILLGPWSRGVEIVMHGGEFDPAERLELIGFLGVTTLCQSPTHYRLMAEHESLDASLHPRLRHAVSTGEPLRPELIELFRDRFGLTIHDGYGQTENSVLVASTRDRPAPAGSMGWPTPGHHVAVIDQDGNEVGVGVEGDIALRGRPPLLFLGYWNAPDATAAAFRGDWYVTGDRATRDDDGSIWFTTRADDVIRSATHAIRPLEMESALLGHPAVAETAVVGKTDPDQEQIVKAFVVPHAGHEPSDLLASELQEHVRRVSASDERPLAIEFVAELPKTIGGKVRRAALRQLELDRAGGQEQLVAEDDTPPHSENVARDRVDDAYDGAPPDVTSEDVQWTVQATAQDEAARAAVGEHRATASPEPTRRERREAKKRARRAEKEARLAEKEPLHEEAAERSRQEETELETPQPEAEREPTHDTQSRRARREERKAERRRRRTEDEFRRVVEAARRRTAEAERRSAEKAAKQEQHAEKTNLTADGTVRRRTDETQRHPESADPFLAEQTPATSTRGGESTFEGALLERLQSYGVRGSAPGNA